ncbi:uncharacterized protein LOC132058075 [Lycium ferocissimum]|uniref:uncharacterized protein LOC132058075 n=1 Tax=Lycium ferocissimum TaxID=112874 RepID=UPI002815EFE4|nr:uncharacterized protein LOC132058075 [Lycium ferocissimum]
MAPHGETIGSSNIRTKNLSQPPRLSNDSLKRTMSEISYEWMNNEVDIDSNPPPISEVENAKCECCGMSEEYTSEYIGQIRKKYSGKWICGLCADAVKEEAQKNGGKNEEALSTHMSACHKFNKYGRAYPVLYQAEAMREMLKKNTKEIMRAKSISPRDRTMNLKKGGITRTNSCIPAITKEMSDLNVVT